MNKYEQLMDEIYEFLSGTWLSKPRRGMKDRGAITGCSADVIREMQNSIGKPLPQAMIAWYRRFGEVPLYLNDHGADYSVRNFYDAQQVAQELTKDEASSWKLSPSMIPFSERLGIGFLFVDTSVGDSNDPGIFSFFEVPPSRQVQIAFSVDMREMLLSWLDFPVQDYANSSEIGSWREKGYDDWLPRKHVIDALQKEAYKFRGTLIQQIHEEDNQRDTITGPQRFQERWLDEFKSSPIYDKFQAEGVALPCYWITPPVPRSR